MDIEPTMTISISVFDYETDIPFPITDTGSVSFNSEIVLLLLSLYYLYSFCIGRGGSNNRLQAVPRGINYPLRKIRKHVRSFFMFFFFHRVQHRPFIYCLLLPPDICQSLTEPHSIKINKRPVISFWVPLYQTRVRLAAI